MPIIDLNSLSPEICRNFSMTESQLRREGLCIVESPNVIERALAGGIEPLGILCERRNIPQAQRLFATKFGDIPIFVADKDILASITGYSLSRGIMCLMRRPDPMDMALLLPNAKRICVIYDVCDAVNVGVIFRSAAALGYDGVILSSQSCDPLNRRTTRVSMGGVFQIPWCRGEMITRELRNSGFTIVSTALSHESVSLEKFQINREDRYALIFGSEGYGLPADIISESDYCVNIPMKAEVDSLNVGAAAAIILWSFRS